MTAIHSSIGKVRSPVRVREVAAGDQHVAGKVPSPGRRKWAVPVTPRSKDPREGVRVGTSHVAAGCCRSALPPERKRRGRRCRRTQRTSVALVMSPRSVRGDHEDQDREPDKMRASGRC